ncbi:Postreplication repair E3 ubiquitin-protein ligase rad18 [Cercospora beticola]|uniref:Postreplication repair E3 ubiquitin-protein ligase RAD18 n=1 Tax=Cercospora beticola TaxID=122368 RepID=A0A2G5HA10_CERBT|nr:Postreplication repair E3 ubiquitin-protein ligase rad18 [Cercospora beticola]PIA89375.1 Postreplication repair E3 ubiquitin-protein ligase rad18 [Cercospora beticola]WPB03091.1 hypothetical protein RHO25_007728 [Cercospora beticola]CAK1358204.1 unnamed protein product [Cercospora beticola]
MDDAYDVPDSTDWLDTPLKAFAPLENALHCQICKEFYDTPMITSCNHTFCSRCIRTSLSADGKCPACRASDQASKLRNNWAIQEVVATFLEARPIALEVARKSQQETATPKKTGKRKRPTIPDSDDVAEVQESGRTTRAKSRRIAASQSSQQEAIEIEDSDEEAEEEYKPESPPKDGLVECPLGCGKRMKEAEVFNHLDKCEDEQKQASRAKSRTPLNGFVSSRPPSGQGARPQDRINELNYGMLKDKALSAKLKEQGLPAFGSKQLMINRHREWVNIWNANCDSNSPRSRRDLLRDLDVWEKTQGGKAPQGNGLTHAVMRKDFDGAAYSRKHNDDFSRLIADARRKKSSSATTSASAKDVTEQKQTEADAIVHGDGESPVFAAKPPPLMVPPQDRRMSLSQPEPSPVDRSPYEHDPEALANVREKVKALNDGRTPTPVLNKGFENPSSHVPAASPQGTRPSSSQPQHEPPSMFSGTIERVSEGADPNRYPPTATRRSASISLDSGNGVQLRRGSSRDEHLSEHSGSPCDLSSHVVSSQSKRVPMFAMPEQPVTDVEGLGGSSSGV